MFKLEILEICELVWSTRIFALFSFMWLSIAGVKSKNEFAQQKVVEAKLHVMVARQLEKLKKS